LGKVDKRLARAPIATEKEASRGELLASASKEPLEKQSRILLDGHEAQDTQAKRYFSNSKAGTGVGLMLKRGHSIGEGWEGTFFVRRES